jgi:hypothetical protein
VEHCSTRPGVCSLMTSNVSEALCHSMTEKCDEVLHRRVFCCLVRMCTAYIAASSQVTRLTMAATAHGWHR